jgi:hypothetical protein
MKPIITLEPLCTMISYRIITYNKVKCILKYKEVRFKKLTLIKYYAPKSPILFLAINKVIIVHKFKLFRLDQLLLIKHYTPLSPIEL